jgi:hypothetical protein
MLIRRNTPRTNIMLYLIMGLCIKETQFSLQVVDTQDGGHFLINGRPVQSK